MEASEHTEGQEPQVGETTASEEAAPVEGGAGAEGDAGAEGGDAEAVPTAADENVPADAEERNPAEDQAPVATAAQDAVIGDPGLRDEQEPTGGNAAADLPHRTSPPPPSAQSGVPLQEDRDAGVEPGTSGPAVGGEGSEGETPEHDASEGQSTTPPLG